MLPDLRPALRTHAHCRNHKLDKDMQDLVTPLSDAFDLQQWNVDRDLLRFVKDPRGFRTQLGKCDGLISGSFALQFFERVYWGGSGLDVFAENRGEAREFEHYLVNVENYKLSRESFNTHYRRIGPAGV